MIPVRYRPLTFALVILLFILLAIVLLYRAFDTGNKEQFLQVTFLDVGQGDATFIESPSGAQVLIDGGRDASVLRGLTKTMGYFDRDIDMVMATHPDSDHISGLIDVLKRYTVHTIVMTENESDTPVYHALLESIAQEGATVVYARRGQVFDLGMGVKGSTTLSVLFPDHDPRGLESNTSSIVAQLQYGQIEFMLTGDSPQAIEEYLVSGLGSVLESEVLKAGHHGSRTSSSELFVSQVQPAIAVISAGKDNAYGHPHIEVTDLFSKHGVITKNTADFGSIFLESNGAQVWVK